MSGSKDNRNQQRTNRYETKDRIRKYHNESQTTHCICIRIIQIIMNKQPYPDFKGTSAHSHPHIKNLRELDLAHMQKPKTLIILHYNGKRISVPLFDVVLNLAQLLYHHISKLEQTILNNDPNWEKKSNSQIVCFQIKKDERLSDAKTGRESDGDLRSDVLLSLLRIQSENHQDCVEQLSLKVDVTKVYKYLQIQPFFRFFHEEHAPFARKDEPTREWPYYQFHRLLASSRVCNTYLTRRVGNGHFYAVRVYATGSESGIEQIRTISQMQQVEERQKDLEVKCSLLCVSHQIAFVPNPDAEEYEQEDDESNCKHIALVYPYFVKGSLEELLKQRYSRSRRIIEMDCLNYLKELMWGAHMLHQKYNLLHRAIVPANLQIDQNNQLRLVNYCSCLPCYDGEGSPINYIKNDRKYESYHSGELDEMFEEGEFDLGEYAAPEVAKGQPYNYLVDFYAIGVIIKKLYEQSQVLEKVPVSQNNENLMMTMINKLTSADLEERAAIAEEIIENIERENLEGEQAVLAATTINLQEIKVGRPIELGEVKRFIQNEEYSNGIEHETVINFFRQPNIKRLSKTRTVKKTGTKKLSKEKNSVKNSREKSEKCLSKNSADSLHDSSLSKPRKISKKKNDSFNTKKDESGSQVHLKKEINKQGSSSKPKKSLLRQDSPNNKRPSKSNEKKRKEQIAEVPKRPNLQPDQIIPKHKSPVSMAIPKSPKGVPVRSKSPGQLRQKPK